MRNAADRHFGAVRQSDRLGQRGDALRHPVHVPHQQRHAGPPARAERQRDDNGAIARVDAQADAAGAGVATPLHPGGAVRQGDDLRVAGLWVWDSAPRRVADRTAAMPYSLASMTGFARTEGTVETLTWAWELRAVNGRGLELRFRLPTGWDALEPGYREMVGKAAEARQRQRQFDDAAGYGNPRLDR